MRTRIILRDGAAKAKNKLKNITDRRSYVRHNASFIQQYISSTRTSAIAKASRKMLRSQTPTAYQHVGIQLAQLVLLMNCLFSILPVNFALLLLFSANAGADDDDSLDRHSTTVTKVVEGCVDYTFVDVFMQFLS